ncbi:hypothetical protein DRN52_08745 [Thermococci archaeon]|nr:MAG: hypothetical protein DRN52_08745 [Thermococci archaeon]
MKGLKSLEAAINDYLRGKASLGGAAEEAGMSYCDFREELRRRGILSKRKAGLT